MTSLKNTKIITYSALLMALNVILSEHLSITTEFIKFNFGFVPVVLAAILFGPKIGLIVAGLGDLIGFFVFPQVGAYFPGFSLTAALTGLVYGLCLYSEKTTIQGKNLYLRATLAAFLVNGVLYTGLNSFWLGYLYGAPYIMGVLPIRIASNAALFCLQVALIPMLFTLKTRLVRSTYLEMRA